MNSDNAMLPAQAGCPWGGCGSQRDPHSPTSPLWPSGASLLPRVFELGSTFVFWGARLYNDGRCRFPVA
jgi:hypothetical protein